MILLMTIFAIFAINCWYLFSVRQLMVKLKDRATSYWEKIGRPDSFAANHGMAILSNLYKEEMASVCRDAGINGLLKSVRVLLPVTFLTTGLLLLALAWLLKGGSI
jgi:hypothetical protein